MRPQVALRQLEFLRVLHLNSKSAIDTCLASIEIGHHDVRLGRRQLAIAIGILSRIQITVAIQILVHAYHFWRRKIFSIIQ